MPRQVVENIAIAETTPSLRRIFEAIQDYFQEVSKKFGLTSPQLWALKTVSAHGSLSLGELSKKMYLHPNTISGMMDRLERKGFFARNPGQEDRRAVKVHLTPKEKGLWPRPPIRSRGR